MKSFTTYLKNLPSGPKSITADLFIVVLWVWIYFDEHNNKQLTPLWMNLELTIVVMSSVVLLLHFAAAYVKWKGRTPKDSWIA